MALDYKLMGERLKKARIQKGYTQEKLAEIMGLSTAYVSRIENGKTHVNLTRLNELCTLLDTSESYVLNGASDNSISYLNNELSSILKDCSSKDKELIYQIATIISDKNSRK
ncbi:MAG: helix-turn-helix domain-containing protein [Clostridia bacterium]|nr:helix-turn-helix domain-containing protein [Clostridia bacterium]